MDKKKLAQPEKDTRQSDDRGAAGKLSANVVAGIVAAAVTVGGLSAAVVTVVKNAPEKIPETTAVYIQEETRPIEDEVQAIIDESTAAATEESGTTQESTTSQETTVPPATTIPQQTTVPQQTTTPTQTKPPQQSTTQPTAGTTNSTTAATATQRPTDSTTEPTARPGDVNIPSDMPEWTESVEDWGF